MAREVCEIHVADTSAADPALQVVGRFVLDDGKLTYELEKGDSGTALMFKRILLEDIPVYVPDGGGGQTVEINSRKNPAQVQSPEGGAASGYPLLLRLHLEAARPLETDKYEI